jgi:hypothetical protein
MYELWMGKKKHGLDYECKLNRLKSSKNSSWSKHNSENWILVS